MLLGKVLTILPPSFVKDKLAASSPEFCETFSRELRLLEDERMEYEARVDSIFDQFLACFPSEKKVTQDSSLATPHEGLLVM